MTSATERLRESLVKRLFQRRETGVFFALVGLIVYMSLASPYFLGQENIFNVLRNMSSITVMAIGMTMIIVTSGIDLSIGSTLAVTSMLAARMMYSAPDVFLAGYSPWLAIPLCMIFGALIGLSIGIIITKLNVNPFITTLGMLSIGRGITYLLATGIRGTVASNIPMKNAFINFIGIGKIGPEGFQIPMQVVIMFVLVLLFSLFLMYTVLGRQVYAVGSNAEAARLTGVNVHFVQIFVYTLTGLLCALAGLMNGGLVGAAVTNAGAGAEMDVIAAVIIGGTSLAGGEGTIIGAVIGAAIMAVLKNAFVLLHLPVYLQTVSIGVVIIFAVALDGLRRRGQA
jgi:ribose transport system permease protein